eukprot:TRINITY_DN36300_c0_g1_i2.p1 TRINITY_DN36300_c0_g1~~TRINITY_DN36300_c0_g1_i2.p1  ORF type:complete len:293 (+),score=36.97 TRINITY_DN36300_c0_g1_i2:385-1263(+)
MWGSLTGSPEDDWNDCTDAPMDENDAFLLSEFGLDEPCVDWFSCALQQTILMHGFMYITHNHVCFHSNIIGIVTSEVIPLQDVVNVSVCTQAFINPGISLHTATREYGFFSFTDRDLASELLTNIWQFRRMNITKPKPALGLVQEPASKLDMHNSGLRKLVLDRWLHSAEFRALRDWRLGWECERLCVAEVASWCYQRFREIVRQAGPSQIRRIAGIMEIWQHHHVACSLACWREKTVAQLMARSLEHDLEASLQYTLSRVITNPERTEPASPHDAQAPNSTHSSRALKMCH